ncbi:hypothetical protein DPMN_182981 [Dreissena polymorpha]|uniref:Uncharacterized protein n=1 Tax=Dreissena polymorpha TaxID=45954 RepID=A0A9D4DHL1_DREPO|nr:hypothetical protein DPMN_182981 [Dreissena polymorpha]
MKNLYLGRVTTGCKQTKSKNETIHEVEPIEISSETITKKKVENLICKLDRRFKFNCSLDHPPNSTSLVLMIQNTTVLREGSNRNDSKRTLIFLGRFSTRSTRPMIERPTKANRPGSTSSKNPRWPP